MSGADKNDCASWCDLPADHDGMCANVLTALPGYPWLPCPICRGIEGCDHAVPERARTALPGLVLPTATIS